MKLRSSALTDIGRVRSENEDSFLSDDGNQLYAVADGIGGLPSGAQASQLAIFALKKLFNQLPAGPEADYPQILTEINRQVFILGRVLSPQHGIGCTLTFAHLTGDKLHIGHVGDSAVFRLRAKVLEQLTSDHTVENERKARAARGEPMGMHLENRNALTRCIGQPPPLEGECLTHAVLPHDRYLLATDGITRFISPTEIRDVLEQTAEPAEATAVLVELANQRGGLDNATAVILFFD